MLNRIIEINYADVKEKDYIIFHVYQKEEDWKALVIDVEMLTEEEKNSALYDFGILTSQSGNIDSQELLLQIIQYSVEFYKSETYLPDDAEVDILKDWETLQSKKVNLEVQGVTSYAVTQSTFDEFMELLKSVIEDIQKDEGSMSRATLGVNLIVFKSLVNLMNSDVNLLEKMTDVTYEKLIKYFERL